MSPALNGISQRYSTRLIHATYKYQYVRLLHNVAHTSLALNDSSELHVQRFEHSDAIERHNRIMFVFHPGLPHMYIIP